MFISLTHLISHCENPDFYGCLN